MPLVPERRGSLAWPDGIIDLVWPSRVATVDFRLVETLFQFIMHCVGCNKYSGLVPACLTPQGVPAKTWQALKGLYNLICFCSLLREGDDAVRRGGVQEGLVKTARIITWPSNNVVTTRRETVADCGGQANLRDHQKPRQLA